MDDNVFVLLDDPLAPTRADVLAAAPSGEEMAYLQGPTHFRTTFLTLRPPGALEQLLAQLKARWVSVRQSSFNASQRGQTSGQQLTIDGHQYAIGSDWLLRVGNVCLAGGGIKGMVLEAEYLPLPVLHSPVADGTSELLSNLLTSILPNVKDAKTVAVTISDSQWEDVLWDREQSEGVETTPSAELGESVDASEDIYAYGDEDVPGKKPHDWVGIDRDRLHTAKRFVNGSFNARAQSTTALHFYQNRQLELYASKPAQRLTLRQLIFFGRSMDEERLIKAWKSANYVRTELPVRIAHRLRDLQALPYVVVTQEGVAKTYEVPLQNVSATVIPNLSLGLSLSSHYLPPDQLDSFMRRMLVSRISRRVLAEHHISLSEIQAGTHTNGYGSEEPHVGIIFTGLNVRRSIERCVKLLSARPLENSDGAFPTKWPEVVIEGHLDTKFAYIREHLEHQANFISKSFHATLLKHCKSGTLPPIRATIVDGENDVGIRISDQGGGLLTPENPIKTPSDLFSFSHVRNASRLEDSRIGALRTFSSSSQGIKATVGEQVDRWKNEPDTATNPEKEAGVGPHARIGIGLPMSNIFATYFGGSLELISMDGWGTDVYLRLPKLGTNLEGIEV
ncbi:hypothetical protein H0H93_007193 [Arthromyces matolae]|nr:hypothetical protein H0H93_007193 [Arthromyces matolae]